MSPEVLDTLVKLASAGTSGVCVAIVAATGWVIYKLPPSVHTERYSLLKFYMKATLAIAIISALSTAFALFLDFKTATILRDKVATLEDRTESQAEQITKSEETVADLSSEVQEKSSLVKSLNVEAQLLEKQRDLSKKRVAELETKLTKEGEARAALANQIEILTNKLNRDRFANPER